ncbi:MAG: aminotransferase class I/II-fold pyridoxal phosphate-dependent enzyme [Candidatus Riflebacteria bacterium]|nr:aminotransferase class I/II-fold pyridoxal phosphate-dependent enzyme [Candidatus Riflebacteria bacterium]
MDISNFDLKDLVQDDSISLNQKMDILHNVIEEAKRQKLYLYFRTTNGPSEDHIQATSLETGKPRDMIMMASNNYLGFTTNPEIKRRAIEIIEKWGIGMAGPCSLNGNTVLHQELEEKLARFKHCEAAMIFPSGYSANIGVITALLGKDDFFIGDELNHGSLIDGARYSRAERLVFKHSDCEDLERCLAKCEGKPGQKFVAVDGVYSMDGEIAPLRRIVDLCKKYNAMLLVDDAHGTGAVGANGRGSLEHCGVEGEVDIVMATFSKAFGCFGGFIAGSRQLITWLRFFGRSGMYTASVSPVIVGACLAGLEMMQNHPELIRKVQENARYVRSRLTQMGYKTSNHETAIIPVFLNDRMKTYSIVKEAYERGLFLSLIEYPAVPHGTERIRMTVMATHSREDLDKALDLLCELGKKYGAI